MLSSSELSERWLWSADGATTPPDWVWAFCAAGATTLSTSFRGTRGPAGGDVVRSASFNPALCGRSATLANRLKRLGPF